MSFCPPTIAVAGLVSIGVIFAVPVLAQGFSRRGKGVFYENNFLLQRAPPSCFPVLATTHQSQTRARAARCCRVLRPLADR